MALSRWSNNSEGSKWKRLRRRFPTGPPSASARRLRRRLPCQSRFSPSRWGQPVPSHPVEAPSHLLVKTASHDLVLDLDRMAAMPRPLSQSSTYGPTAWAHHPALKFVDVLSGLSSVAAASISASSSSSHAYRVDLPAYGARGGAAAAPAAAQPLLNAPTRMPAAPRPGYDGRLIAALAAE